MKYSLALHCSKWAGKPRILSPLMCARYGWINVGYDMLKCSSCHAFLCASLPSALDFKKCEQLIKGKDSVVLHYSKCQKYIFIFHFVILDESRIAEITKQLQTQHEKFCPWPDFPCPGRSKNILLLIYILYIFTLNYKNVMFNLNICIISERFWLIPACEPSILLTAFLERFRSTCLLGQQLPALKSEHLKSMVRQ